MQSVLIVHCFICRVSLLFTALQQGVLTIYFCFICNVSLLFTSLHAGAYERFKMYEAGDGKVVMRGGRYASSAQAAA